MAVLRLFASVRVAAGTGSLAVPGETVGEVLAAADEKFGDGFASLAATCRVWLNGESVSYTLLTLPTNREVETAVCAGLLKQKRTAIIHISDYSVIQYCYNIACKLTIT